MLIQTKADLFKGLFPSLDSCTISNIGKHFADLVDSIDPDTLFDLNDDNHIVLIFSDGSSVVVAGPECH
jgi:hypothetical protein